MAIEEVNLNDPVEVEKAMEADSTIGPLAVPSLSNLTRSASIAKLTAALAQAAMEFDEIVKESENPFFKNSASGGKYADLAGYIGATRKQLGKYGLVVIQFPGVSEKAAGVTTLLSHTSGEWMQGDLPLPISRHDPQGVASSITYSRRYSYGPMLNLAAEDDDGNEATATRKEHLENLTQQMASQERISQVQVKAFEDTAAKNGRTQEQIKAFLDELNGYVQVNEIMKTDWDKAKTWALNQPKDDDLIGQLIPSLQQAKLKKLYAIAGKKKVSDEDLHQMIEETFKKKSVKELTQKEFEGTTEWLESLNPAG